MMMMIIIVACMRAVSRQSIGQLGIAQLTASSSGAHDRPPCRASCWTDRARTFSAPPDVWQVFAQPLHAPHAVAMQSSGHALPVHDVAAVREGHAPPDGDGCAATDRVRDMVPAAQDLEHEDHGPQSPTTQSTGHSNALHAFSDDRSGHLQTGKRTLPQPKIKITSRMGW